jgi:hypothetical protein
MFQTSFRFVFTNLNDKDQFKKLTITLHTLLAADSDVIKPVSWSNPITIKYSIKLL